jgi:phosphoglycerate kinase
MDPRRRSHGLFLPGRPGLQGRHLPAGESQVDIVAGYPDQAARAGTEIVLPSDVIVAAEPAADTPHEVVAVDAILADRMGLDIGPESARFSPPASSGSIRFLEWPVGVFELSAYADGTRAVAQALAGSNACTVVGGGDAGSAIRALGYSESAFGLSPPAAARAWSSSRAAPCPAWPR